MATATGSREIPYDRQLVWRSLTDVTSYCPVCDVSYVFDDDTTAGARAIGPGSRFVCVPGRREGGKPPPNAVAGEVAEWAEERCLGTRLTLASETWQTHVELDDGQPGSTRVTVTVACEPKGGGRLRRSLRRRALQRLVQHTVDSELAKLPAHMGLAPVDEAVEAPGEGILMQQEADGWVLHLRGEVDAPAVRRLNLQQRLEGVTVVAVDVSGLTYLDAVALPPLLRWARAASRAGRPARVRGANPEFDRVIGVMGMSSVFLRQS